MLLRLEDVSKDFDGRSVLEHVHLDVAVGEWVGFIGPNGGGKTTLLNVISRLIAPSSGHVVFDGEDITRRSPSDLQELAIARVFQQPYFNHRIPVLENVALGVRRAKASPALPMTAARLALDAVGFSLSAVDTQRRVDRFQSRLIELARVLVARPRLVLLDEPAAGFDSDERARLKVALNVLRRTGTAVILVEHDHHLVGDLCDRLVSVRDGRLATSEESRSGQELSRA